MASLTIMNGLTDHQNLDTASGSNGNNSPATTYLLTTTVAATTVETMSTSRSNSMSKIAPKRPRSSDSSTNSANSNPSQGKRRSSLHQRGSGAAPAVARRNERERNRVRQVNMGFATLRQHVPNGAKSKKMSKVETLRSAVQYIKQLQQLLNDEADDTDENSAPSFEGTLHFHPPHHHPQQPSQHLSFPGSFEAGVHFQPSASGQTIGFGSLTSPGCSAASSPTPSLGSEAASSPYDSLSPEDEELLDFTTWLS